MENKIWIVKDNDYFELKHEVCIFVGTEKSVLNFARNKFRSFEATEISTSQNGLMLRAMEIIELIEE